MQYKMGALMIGTYWCPHCQHQKEIFGKEAWRYIRYVEASPKGYGFDPDAIKKVGVEIDGFPTWFLKGTSYSGEMPLKLLAEISGYPGLLDESLEVYDSSSITTRGSCR